MNLLERYTLQRGIKTSKLAFASKNNFIDNYILNRQELNKQYREQLEKNKKEKEFEEAIEKVVEKAINNILKEENKGGKLDHTQH